MLFQIRKFTYCLLLISLFIFSCQSEHEEISIVYQPTDFNLISWKDKGDFEASFLESIYARWGYIKGRDVAIILYPNPEVAKNKGNLAGLNQTEFINEAKKTELNSGDSGSFFGPNVEKTECRGFSGAAVFRGECPRREPLYTVYKIDGNALFLFAPLRSEDESLASDKLEELVILLKERYKQSIKK